MRRAVLGLGLAFMAALAACGGDADEEPGAGPLIDATIRDSAGIRIVEHGPLGSPPEVWTVGSVDTLLGPGGSSAAPGGGATPEFGRIQKGVLLEDGRAAVVDESVQAVWVVGHGQPPRRITGEQGETAVERVGGVMVVGDTLLVYDGPASRLLRFAGPELDFVGARDLPGAGGAARSLLHVGGDRFAMVTVENPTPPEGRRAFRLRADVAWWFADRPDTLVQLQAWPGRSWYRIGNALGLLPYGPAAWFAGGAGRLAVGESSRAEVVLLDAGEEEVRLIRWAGLKELPRTVVDAYVDRLMVNVPEGARPGVRGIMESVPFPGVYPSLQELILVEPTGASAGAGTPGAGGDGGGSESERAGGPGSAAGGAPASEVGRGPGPGAGGELWVGEFVGTLVELGPGARRPQQGWRVFDLEGRFLATLTTGEGSRLLDVDAQGRVLQVRRDESGRQAVILGRVETAGGRR